jgi:CHAT domain-containing protein
VESLKVVVPIAQKQKMTALQDRYLRELADAFLKLPEPRAQADGLAEVLDHLTLPKDMQFACGILEKLEPLYRKLNDLEGLGATVTGKGRCRENAGDTEGELKEYADAIAIFRKTKNRAVLATVLNASAETLRAHQRYAEALPLQDEAVSIRATLDDAREYAQSLNNLALLHQSLGHLPQAVEAIDKSLKLTRTQGTKEDLAASLANTASIYRDVGRLKEASGLIDECLKICREEHLDDQARIAMHVLAGIHMMEGDPIAAASAAVAEDSAGRARGQSQPKFLSHNLGVALVKLGNYAKAAEIFEAELKRSQAGKDPAEIASAQEGLAAAYYGSGNYTSAESHMIEAEKIYRFLGDPKDLSNTLTNLAQVYVGMGRYYDALARYGEVARLSASMQAPRPQIETLLATADVYRRLKSYDQALDDAMRAERLSEKQGFEATAGQARQAQALIQLGMGNFEEAERLYRAKNETGAAHAVLNDGLVEVFLATNRFREADTELARISADDLAKADVDYRIQYFTQRGIARLGLHRTSEAIDDFNLAVQAIEELRMQVMGRPSVGFLDSGSFGGRVRPYRGMVEAMAAIALSGAQARVTIDGKEISGARVQITIGDKEYDATSAAHHFAEEMPSRTLVERLAFSRYEELRRRLPQSVLDEEKQMTDRAMALAKEVETRKNAGDAATPAQIEEMAKLREAARAHVAALQKNYPQYARLFSPSTIPLEELQLSPGEAVLEYAIGLRCVFLFITEAGHPLRLVCLPVSAKDLETEVQVFRDLLVAKRFSPTLANDLFQHLLGSVLQYKELPERLVIVPDGFLGLLPFEALVTEPGTTSVSSAAFLGVQHSIDYAQSTSVMAWTRNFGRKQAERPLFALADPIFSTDDPRYKPRPAVKASEPVPGSKPAETVAPPPAAPQSGSAFRRLPETQAEVEKVASIMGIEAREPDVLTGASATKAAVMKTGLGRYRFLHFATHAAALGDPGVVNEPFLVLGQVDNARETDGLLTMSEIMDLRLNAELVVLAACDTGSGDVLQGDGVASLASAFQFAGAESVVLSLWELPSEASRSYMETFYRYLKEGRGKAEALRLSRDAMKKQYADPYYWAVFSLYSGSNR